MTYYSYIESQYRLSNIFLLDACAHTPTNTDIPLYTEIPWKVPVSNAESTINGLVWKKKICIF